MSGETQLPDGWAWSTLGECVIPVRKVEPALLGRDEFTYVDISSVDSDSLTVATPQRLPVGSAPSRARQLLKSGDTVFSTVRPNLRRIAPIGDSLDGEIASTGFCVLRPAAGLAPKFLFHFLSTEAFLSAVNGKARGVSYPAVRPIDILEESIPIPPLAEQHRIVEALEDHLSRLDAAVAWIGNVQARVDDLDVAVLRSIQTEASADPKYQLGEVADVQGGIQKKPDRRPAHRKAPFLRVANVHRNSLDLQDVHEVELFESDGSKYFLESGDLLVVEGNGSIKHLGRAAMWCSEIPGAVHQNHLIRVRAGTALLPDYLALIWNAPDVRGQLRAVAGSTSGLHTLSVSKLKRIRISVPDRRTQELVVEEVRDYIGRFQALIGTVNVSRLRAASLRNRLLSTAFSGTLVDQDPADEPASLLLERIAAERESKAPARRRRPAKSGAAT